MRRWTSPDRCPCTPANLSRNHAAFLQLLIKDGALALNFEDEVVREACMTHEGKIVHARAREVAEGQTS